MKNTLLGLALGALAVMIALLAAGKLTWSGNKTDHRWSEAQQKALLDANEMAKPTVLQVGDRQILSIPKIEIQGDGFNVSHILATVSDEGLKKLDFVAGE